MAAEREVLEETGLAVKAEKILYIREVKYKKKYGLEFYVLCKYVSGTPRLGKDPELGENDQILTRVEEIDISKLDTVKWRPEELQGVLIKETANLEEI